jgi:hypothetical protein
MAKKFRYEHRVSDVNGREPSSLLVGEIAVNRYAGNEKLFIENSSGETVSFSSDQVIEGKIDTALGGLTLLQITQSDYDALQSYDPHTLYIIVN